MTTTQKPAYGEKYMTQTEVSLTILERPITSFILSSRIMKCLKNENIKTIGDLVKFSESELKRIPQFGPGSWKELKDRLDTLGIVLRAYKPRDEPAPVDLEALAAQRAIAYNKSVVPDWY